MAVSVFIKGASTSNLGITIVKNSMRVQRGLGNKNSLQIAFNCQPSVYIPRPGYDIQVYDDSGIIFGGVIDEINIEKIDPVRNSNANIIVSCSSNGYEAICTRRTVNVFYENKTDAYIIENILYNTLLDSSNWEGVTKGNIESSVTFSSYSAICKSVKEIFDDIASQCGMIWYINDSKSLNYEAALTDYGTADHSIDVTGTFTDYQIMSLNSSFDNYCNKVFARGGNSDAFYATAINTSEITLRKSAEGTAYSSGVYGKVIDVGDISDISTLQLAAEAELVKYNIDPYEISVKSSTSTWTVGKYVQCYLPDYGITQNMTFLIENVSITLQDNIFEYDISMTRRNTNDTAAAKSDKGKEYFEKLLKKSGGGGALSTGVVAQIDHFQSSNTSNVTVTTQETQIKSTSFTTLSDSDIQFAFSTHISASSSIHFHFHSYLQDADGATTQGTFVPNYNVTSNDTMSYNDFFVGITAGTSTLVITGESDTGTINISAGQSALNVLILPNNLTASNSATVSTYNPLVLTANMSLYDTPRKPSLVKVGNSLYFSYKYVDGANIFDVMESKDWGQTWSSLNMPTASSAYSAGESYVANACLSYYNNKLHVAHLERTTASTTNMLICYNYYDISLSAWYSSNMIEVKNTAYTSYDSFCDVSCVVDINERVHLTIVAGTASTTQYIRHAYSDDFGGTWTSWDLVHTYGKEHGLFLDINGEDLHLLFRVSSPAYNILYRPYVSGVWGDAETVKVTAGQEYSHKLVQCSDGRLVALTEVTTDSPDTVSLMTKTAGATSWSTLADYSSDNVYLNLAIKSDNVFALYSVTSGGDGYVKNYSITDSAWETSVLVPHYTASTNVTQQLQFLYSSGTLFAVYQDGTASTTQKIIFLRSEDY